MLLLAERLSEGRLLPLCPASVPTPHHRICPSTTNHPVSLGQPAAACLRQPSTTCTTIIIITIIIIIIAIIITIIIITWRMGAMPTVLQLDKTSGPQASP